jgi:hypothetical protein
MNGNRSYYGTAHCASTTLDNPSFSMTFKMNTCIYFLTSSMMVQVSDICSFRIYSIGVCSRKKGIFHRCSSFLTKGKGPLLTETLCNRSSNTTNWRPNWSKNNLAFFQITSAVEQQRMMRLSNEARRIRSCQARAIGDQFVNNYIARSSELWSKFKSWYRIQL